MNLVERLNQEPVLCAEGYLFAMERRGYLQAGAYVPEVVLEHPEVCLLYTSPSPRDKRQSRMPSSA